MVGDEAGGGVNACSDTFAFALARAGLNVFTTQDYRSLIKGDEVRGGGHINSSIRVSDKTLHTHGDGLDVLIAMDWGLINNGKGTIATHAEDINPGGIIIYDNSKNQLQDAGRFTNRGITIYGVPAKTIAEKDLKFDKAANMALIGAACAAVNFDKDFKTIEKMVQDFFGRKGPDIVAKNLEAVRRGAAEVAAQGVTDKYRLDTLPYRERLLINGNQAFSLGALAGGCRWCSSYPITPASDIMEELAKHFQRYNGHMQQCEDELAAISAAIGASLAGARSLTCTSGPGLSLKQESIGLAAVTETPLVIVDVMRVGPSTGMPTKTSQEDLNQMLYGTHGEIPKIILAPGDVAECFEAGWRSFNLADKYQTPVFVALDRYLGQAKVTIDPFDFSKVRIERGKLLEDGEADKDYKRHEYTADGISLRALPGHKNAIIKTTGVEHTEFGNATENRETRKRNMQKRMGKEYYALSDMKSPQEYGMGGLTLVGWGSTKGVLLETQERLAQKGIRSRVVQYTDVWPIDAVGSKHLFDRLGTPVVIENNYTGQFRHLLERTLGFKMAGLVKYDGQPWTPGELTDIIARSI